MFKVHGSIPIDMIETSSALQSGVFSPSRLVVSPQVAVLMVVVAVQSPGNGVEETSEGPSGGLSIGLT